MAVGPLGGKDSGARRPAGHPVTMMPQIGPRSGNVPLRWVVVQFLTAKTAICDTPITPFYRHRYYDILHAVNSGG